MTILSQNQMEWDCCLCLYDSLVLKTDRKGPIHPNQELRGACLSRVFGTFFFSACVTYLLGTILEDAGLLHCPINMHRKLNLIFVHKRICGVSCGGMAGVLRNSQSFPAGWILSWSVCVFVFKLLLEKGREYWMVPNETGSLSFCEKDCSLAFEWFNLISRKVHENLLACSWIPHQIRSWLVGSSIGLFPLLYKETMLLESRKVAIKLNQTIISKIWLDIVKEIDTRILSGAVKTITGKENLQLSLTILLAGMCDHWCQSQRNAAYWRQA